MTPELVAMAFAVLAGATVQATVGFGSTLVATVVGAQFLPTERLMPLVLPLSALQTLLVVVRTSGSVDRGLLARRILPAMGLGMALVALGPGVAAPGMRPVLGVMVTGLGVLELTRRGPPPAMRAWVAWVALVGAGVIQALLGTGGPLVVWAVGRDVRDGGLTPRTFRSTLSALWLVVDTVLFCVLGASGRINAETLGQTALLVPCALLGGAIGMRLHDHVDEARFRRVLWGLLAACGLPLILSGFS